MGINILLVDADPGNVDCRIIRNTLGYEVDSLRATDVARKSLDKKDYQALIIEPFRKGLPLTPENPEIVFIRDVNSRGIPVMISSSRMEEELAQCCGLVKGTDYQELFVKPYNVEEELCPTLKQIVERQ